MKRFISAVLCAVFLVGAGLYVWAFPPGKDAAAGEGGVVLRLWHIDSFEGGKGSRAAFLSRAASAFEKGREDVYVMVRTLTVQGAAQALRAGDGPDLISFSCGLDGVAEHCLRLQRNFGGGEIGGGTYAYPWCAGQYYLFSFKDDFSAVSAETLVISEGGNNLAAAAAALSGIAGDAAIEDSTAAYVHFLAGKYRYMLGTQRDVCRFQTRGASVFCRPLTAYCDLYQYIAVTADGKEKESESRAFVDFLLGEEVQEKLFEIGMYAPGDAAAAYTLSAFVSADGVASARAAAEGALRRGEIKILKSYLKTLN